MDKSRQRGHKEVESNLNWLRELVVFIFSLALWSYCVVVMYTFVTILIDYINPVNQLILDILKVNRLDFSTILYILSITAIVIFLYLIINYKFNKYEVK